MPCTRVSKIVLFAVIISLILPFATSSAYSAEKTAGDINLTILHTNDVHGMLMPYDYNALGKSEKDVGGAARRVALIRKLKSEAKNPVIVMDAGDVFTRGPWANLMGAPDFEVMNKVPYDIMTLGNNEFKATGDISAQKILFERIKQAKFPIISANVYNKSTGKTIVPPYKILTVKGLKIGIFGLTTPRVATYPQAEGFELRDPVEIAKQMVRELQGKCDFLIALTHIGYADDVALAAAVPQIDVIVGGDSHTWVFKPSLINSTNRKYEPWEIGGTIVAQDGEWGKCVGRIDLRLHKSANGRYHVASYSGQLIDVNSSIQPAKDVEDMLKGYIETSSAKH